MALRTESAVRAQFVSFGKNHCPQCNAGLVAPDWSEYLDDHRARYCWSCDECGYEFETTVLFSAPRQSAA